MKSLNEAGPSEMVGRAVRVRGRRWTIESHVTAADCSSIRLRGLGHRTGITLLSPFDRLVSLERPQRPRVVRPRRWLHELDRHLLSIAPFGSLPSLVRAPIRLLAYQLEPAIAVARGATRLLIADGVGLGKTIQAGIILCELLRRNELCRALVLTPAGVREQWQQELSQKMGLTTVLAETRWLRAASVDRPANVNPWSVPGIYVASHDLVKRPEVLRPLEAVTWDAVVIDEAHAVTAATDRRVAMDAVASRAQHVILLTATPHDGNPPEQAALLRIGSAAADDDPVMIFRRSRVAVRGRAWRRTRVLAVTPSDAERRMHELLERYSRKVWLEAEARGDDRARLVSIVLRKRALSSAGSLLSSVERRLALMTGAAREWQPSLPLGLDRDEDPLADVEPSTDLGTPGLADTGLEQRWLHRIAAAAKSACADERKIRCLMRFLSRVHEPAIVFTEYRDTLTRLASRAADDGHVVLLLHGGQTAAERAAVQRAFNEQGGILLATDAASEGLNLHYGCRIVVHFELPWNPSRLEQRAGRVDRLGQNRVVHELALVASHTAERLVLAPLAVRFAAAEAAGLRTMTALSESSVAAAVMTGVQVPRTQHHPPVLGTKPPLELSELASAEALRLEHHRRLAARTRDSAALCPGYVATQVRTDRIPAGLYLVFAASIKGSDGSTVHVEARLVRVEVHPAVARGLAESRDRLRDIVAALATSPDAPLTRIAEYDDDTYERIVALAGRRHACIRRREEAITGVVSARDASASRALVQAGLFDRRWMRQVSRRQETVAAVGLDRLERDASSEPTVGWTRTAELLAAIHVTSRA